MTEAATNTQPAENGSETVAVDDAPAADNTNTTTAEPTTEPPKAEQVEYTDFTIPDGSLLNGDVLTDYKTVAKEMGLSQEAAQTLITKGQEWQALALEKTSEAWKNQSVNDKEFGGEKLAENLAIASKARDQFATPELKQLLDNTRLGNHPEIIRMFYKLGQQMAEDNRVVSGTRAPLDNATAAQKLYGSKS